MEPADKKVTFDASTLRHRDADGLHLCDDLWHVVTRTEVDVGPAPGTLDGGVRGRLAESKRLELELKKKHTIVATHVSATVPEERSRTPAMTCLQPWCRHCVSCCDK